MVGGFTRNVHNPRHGFSKVHTIQALDLQKVNNPDSGLAKYVHNPWHGFAKGMHNPVRSIKFVHNQVGSAKVCKIQGFCMARCYGGNESGQEKNEWLE